MKSIVLGGVLGGLVLFVWGWVSWGVLPWHGMTLSQFQDENAVEEVLKKNAPEGGIYILPAMCEYDESLSEEENTAIREKMMEKMKETFFFTSISLGGAKSMAAMMLVTLVANMLSAALMTWLLLQTTATTFIARVRFVKMVAVLAACMVVG